MAAVSATTFLKIPTSLNHTNQITGRASSLKLVAVGWTRTTTTPFKTSHFDVSCSAELETVQKVCEIVRKQLALPAESELTPESKFSTLGADSLDTVEIVMGLEEEFNIVVEEDGSQNITTVQEAADLIEELLQKKPKA